MKSIRGAVATVANHAEEISQAARDLVLQICTSNHLSADNIVLIIFTCTDDLTALYPAQAVREAGLSQVPMLCVQEMKVAHSLQGCIRALVLVEDDLPVVSHVYLGEAKKLRPDWVGEGYGI